MTGSKEVNFNLAEMEERSKAALELEKNLARYRSAMTRTEIEDVNKMIKSLKSGDAPGIH